MSAHRVSSTPADISPDGTPITVQTAAPVLWGVVFKRDSSIDVTPSAEEAEFGLKFSLLLDRAHARTIMVELTVHLEGIPWAERRIISVAYRLFFVVRGPVPDTVAEALIRDLGTRIGPATIFPFLRQTVHDLTSKAGNTVTLPLLHWDERFASAVIPPPRGPVPPDILEEPELGPEIAPEMTQTMGGEETPG